MQITETEIQWLKNKYQGIKKGAPAGERQVRLQISL